MSGPAADPDPWPEFDAALRQAVALHAQARRDEAIVWYRRALVRRPGAAEVCNNLAAAHLESGRAGEAIRQYRAALALKPDYARAHLGLATQFQGLGRHGAAIRHFRAALALDPGQPNVRFNLGLSLQASGEAAAAAACYRSAAEMAPEDPTAPSQYLLCLNYLCDRPAEAVAAEHRRVAGRFPSGPPHAGAAPRAPDGRLRIGFLSVEFRQHFGGYFLEPVLEAIDRTRFATACYCALPAANRDAYTARLAALPDLWRDVVGVPDDALLARIRDDGIDVLIDLAGHSGHSRLRALARRAAPVQVTWLGYPNTTGLPAMDARLVDAVTDPPGVGDRLASERLVRLPQPFLCFRPPADAPPVAAPPMRASGRVTFGSFNAPGKLSPATVRLWAAVLRAVPDARLLLKDKAFDCPDTQARIAARFAAEGVAADRIAWAGWSAGRYEHLARYGAVDVALDPTPYNGTITTCDALWMGVPVVTSAGDRHAARVGASLLGAIGLAEECVAADDDGFVRRAAALAADPARLAELRAGMRDRLAASALCDAARFVRAFEEACGALWRERCAAA